MVAQFPLGRLVATPVALALLADSGTDAPKLLERHWFGDRGDVS